MIDKRAALRVTFDPEVDSSYIYFGDDLSVGVSKRCVPMDPVDVGGMINLDLDADGRVLGIEILGASSKLPVGLLRQLNE